MPQIFFDYAGIAQPKTSGSKVWIMTNEMQIPQDMVNEIRDIMSIARRNVAIQVNNELITAYWNIGRVIVEYEQDNNKRAEYGQKTLKLLSRTLTKEFGKGFSISNLQFMRRFYLKNLQRILPLL